MADQAPEPTVAALKADTGQSVQIPTNLAAAFFQAHQIGFGEGSRVPVRLADGQTGSVPAEELQDALDHGADIVSDHELQVASTSAHEGALGTLSTFAHGIDEAAPNALLKVNPITAPAAFARDAIASAVRPADYEAKQADLAEAHPIAHGAGHFLGEAAIALAAPAAELPGMAGAFLRREGGGILASAARGVAREAVRTVPYAAIDAATQGLDERQLSEDPAAAAEKAFATFGTDILGGALAGGLTGGAGGAWQKLRGSAEGASKVFAKGAGVEADGALSKAYSELAAWGKPQDQAKLIRDYATSGSEEAKGFRKLILDRDKSADAITREFRGGIDDMFEGSAQLRPSLTGEMKLEQMRKLVPKTEEAAGAAGTLANHVEAELVTLGQKMESIQPGSSKSLKQMFQGVDEQLARARKAAANPETAGDAYHALDETKRILDREIDRKLKPLSGLDVDRAGNVITTAGGAAGHVDRSLMQEAYLSTRKLADGVREGLEGKAFGAAGFAQSEVNKGFTDAIPALRAFREHMGTRQGIAGEFRAAYDVADPKKIGSWVNNMGRETEALTNERMQSAVDAIDRMHAAVKRSGYELSVADKKALDQMKRGADSFRSTFTRREGQLKDLATFDQLVEDGQRKGLVSAGLGGTLLASLANPFLDPGRTMLNLARAEDAVTRADSRIGKAVLGWLQGKPAIGSTKAATVTTENAPKAMREIAHAASVSPDELAGRIAEHHVGSDKVGPAFQTGLTMAAIRGVYFLSSKLPDQVKTDPLDFRDTAKSYGWKASATEIHKWTSYANAVHDPLSVVEDFRNGTITPEGAEVLQKVYPRLYDSVRSRVLDELVKRPRDLTRVERVNAAMLLGMPTDATMKPEALKASLAMYASKPQNPQPKPSGGSAGGMAKAMGLDTKTTELSKGMSK